MGDLGFGWSKTGAKWGGVIEVLDPKLQTAITEMRTAGLNIMMSMKEEGKPVSFVEDCAVPLEHLAEYTVAAHRRLREARHPRHLVRACLGRLPARAAGAQPAARQGRRGDARHRRGSLRHGARLQGLAFRRARRRHRALGIPREDVRRRGSCAPSRRSRSASIRRACSIPARSCMRRNSTTAACSATGRAIAARTCTPISTGRPIPAPAAVSRARSRCATTTAPAARSQGGVMCPSYRVTRDERDVTRGRANTLRLAITGQLGADALTSDEMAETMKLCVSCKACRRECPTGVDMARMKIEVQAARVAKHGIVAARPADRLSAALCAVRGRGGRKLANLRNDVPRLRRLVGDICRLERAARAAALARRSTGARPCRLIGRAATARPVVSLRRHLQPLFRAGEHRRRARRARRRGLWRASAEAGGRQPPSALLRAHVPRGRARRRGAARGRALRRRARALRRARNPGGRPRAELPPRLPRRDPGADQERGRAPRLPPTRCCSRNSSRARREAGQAEAAAQARGQARAAARPLPPEILRRHAAVETTLKLVPDLAVETDRIRAAAAWPAPSAMAPTPSTSRSRWRSSRCCPPCARPRPTTLVVADGTSCRHQIKDGTGREALHVARVLAMSLDA